MGLAFVIFTYNVEINYNLKSKKAGLTLYNDIAYKAICNNTPYDSIPLPSEVIFTVLDTNFTVLYDNSDVDLAGKQLLVEELELAKKYGSGTLLREATFLDGHYIFYATRRPHIYLRTAELCTEEISTNVKSEQHYIYLIAIMFIVLAVVIFYITRRLSKPIKALQQFVDIVNSNDKDYSRIEFSNDEFGDVGRRIIEIFDRYEQTKFYKEQMSHNVAHELKTPVTAIRAYLETILDMPQVERETVKKFVEKAYSQSLRLTSLINDVSMLNKLDERSDSFVVEEVVLSQCINEVLTEMEYKLVANNVTFTSLISANLRLNGCYTLIYSLFKNLIDNSIEHGGKNITITLSAGINQIAGDGGYRIDFTYTNNGRGIPQETLPRLFERFYRIDEGRTRKTGGCGLGLAIVNNAVLFHRGEILADNLPEGGVVFKFHLYSL
jgi:signal transduction histidine kinase